jgi:hypothetical protein
VKPTSQEVVMRLSKPYFILAGVITIVMTMGVSAWALEGYIGLTNGYFYNTATGEAWVPHGIAYQTWNRPLGVWQTYEQIDYDLDEMVKMGVNSVRIDIVWQHAEEEGIIFSTGRTTIILSRPARKGVSASLP